MRSPFVMPESVCCFSQYAEFNVNTETVLAELGFSYRNQPTALPRVPDAASVPQLAKDRLRQFSEFTMKSISLTSELSRREFLIAPILLQVAYTIQAQIASEHPMDVSERFRGNLDYILSKNNSIVIAEAKNANMVRGFTQLAAKMIAYDQFADPAQPVLYGAVTTGEAWRFGTLQRAEKVVTQHSIPFYVPDDVDDLVAVLVGILEGVPAERAVTG